MCCGILEGIICSFLLIFGAGEEAGLMLASKINSSRRSLNRLFSSVGLHSVTAGGLRVEEKLPACPHSYVQSHFVDLPGVLLVGSSITAFRIPTTVVVMSQIASERTL